MQEERVPFGGLSALEADELVPMERAVIASDCYVDDGTIRGRYGSRNVTAAALGSGGDTPQHLGRFRPSLTSARTVAVLGGKVYLVTDPSAEALSDGSATLLGTPFGSSAVICGAQAGSEYILSTDESGVPWQRIKSDYTLEAFESIPQGSNPTSAKGSLAWVAYRGLAGISYGHSGITLYDETATGSGLPTTWWNAAGAAAGTDPAAGSYAQFKFTAAYDYSGVSWLAFALTPKTGNYQYPVDILIAKDVAGSPGTFYQLGTISDTPGVGGSPNIIFCQTLGIPSDVLAAVQYVRMVTQNGARFGIYGHCALYAMPKSLPLKYYVSFKSASGQRSTLTEALEVNMSSTDTLVPSYPDCYVDGGNYKNNGGSLDPMSTSNVRVYNRTAGKAMPTSSEVAVTVTVSGNVPSGVSGTVTAELWRDVENGRRLIASQTGLAAAAAYSLKDNLSPSVLANELYRAGGTPPQAKALCAAPGRMVGLSGNRVYVSSYLAPDVTSRPFWQFPAIALEEADGWSFDLAPSQAEQGLRAVYGDATYLLTSEACYVMPNLEPNSPIYRLFGRGAMGRQAGIWVEDRLYWASYDGVYVAGNRQFMGELTEPIRRIYRDWLAPSSAVCIGYQERKLSIFEGTKELRFDFVTETWTQHTLAGTVKMAAQWHDP